MKLRQLLPVLTILLTTACAPLYTPETTWESDKSDETFRPDLTACVTQFDPDHLYEMGDNGDYLPSKREYAVSGLFVDTARTQAVVSCMEAKGWDAEGPEWYSGPMR